MGEVGSMSVEAVIDTDVLVIGGTAAGCSAAIAAARGGSSVIILEPTSSIGGITANGVHCFDTGTLQALSGIGEEFVRRVLEHYDSLGVDHPMLRSKSDVFWEFHVAARIWRGMISRFETIRFINGAVPVGVGMDGRKIAEVRWEPAADAFGNPASTAMARPNRVRAKVVIDATHEGDVAAWAGAPFDLGREARSRLEPHAGVIHTHTQGRQVDDNGFLPATMLPGSTGAADDAIMAFTCRLSVRYRETGFERHLLERPPDNYHPGKYSWAPGAVSPQGNSIFGSELIPSLNGKMLFNQRYKGDDLLSGTRDFILAHPRERTAIRKRFYDHVLGFLYFIQNEGGMPQLGLAEDEYVENGHIPHILYVREGRRFRARERMTEADVTPYVASPGPRPPRRPDSIAIGDWAIESRRCSDDVDPGTNTYEGSMFPRALRAPYQVPYGCLTPDGVDNLLVTTTISATHVAFCALRVEAVWTETGTAAGIAANLAARTGSHVAHLPVEAIQDTMLRCNCKLTYFSDVETSHPHFVAIQWLALRGTVPGDDQYRFFPDMTATWGDMVETAVLAFDLPVSVTGFHFEGLDPGHRAFRYAETLYDVASRAGVPLFLNMRHPLIDAPADYLRPEPRCRWLVLEADAAVTVDAATAFLERLSEALGRSSKPIGRPSSDRGPLTKGELASLMMSASSDHVPASAAPFSSDHTVPSVGSVPRLGVLS